MTLELHPLCALFPRMSGAEFESLKADILANGLNQPIVTHNGIVLDGGNRYAACLEVGVKPVTKEYVGENLVTYVMSANFHRRHLSQGQQAAIVASAQDWAKAQVSGGTGANQHKKEQRCNVAPLQTTSDRAAQSGASIRTQKMADKVAKASPDLSIQVAHGEISLPKALKKILPAKQVIESEDMATSAELLDQMQETQAENENLQERIAIITQDDKAAQIDKLMTRVNGLEGRLAQAMNQIKASEDTTKVHAALIHKLRKLLNVEGHKEIYSAVAALVKEKAEA